MKNFELLPGWFYENQMVLNLGKCHYLIIKKGITNESIEEELNIMLKLNINSLV